MREITIIISHLPYPELSPNSRCHWAVKASAVKAAREEVGWLAKEQWLDQPPMMKATIAYRFSCADLRRRDIDNLVAACKAFQDGLVDVGVLFLDDAAHLSPGVSSLTTDTFNRTVIEIEECEGREITR